MPTSLPQRPTDATLSVTKAARLLGVHPNTVRAWSDAGRLRYYRINPRGDRRYRLSDLQRFLATAETGHVDGVGAEPAGPWGGRRTVNPAAAARFARGPSRPAEAVPADPLDAERHHLDLATAASVVRAMDGSTLDATLRAVTRTIAEAYGHHLVDVWETRDGRSERRASAGVEAGAATPPGELGPTIRADGRPELSVAIAAARGPWGVVRVVGEAPGSLGSGDLDLARVTAEVIGVVIDRDGRGGDAAGPTPEYERMATWAAQLQSIQQLGVRLSRLSSVAEIGQSIASELRQLIEYHNVRVYRLIDQDLIPVAILGEIGEYFDETPDQLRLKLGEGITGWVAQHQIAQKLGNAAADARASTIPGTEQDLEESMLLAPMVFDDEVLGVLVLSKLGLDQFTDDDLRLLVIYASFAAQAMANADTTERLREQTVVLERQLRGQRELLLVTESLLTTLDSRNVLESITDRLERLVDSDNVAIELADPVTGVLTPMTARGIHAAEYMEPWAPGETGAATWVVEHNEPVLISDERNDPRVNHFRGQTGEVDGSLVIIPLRGRGNPIGVLTLERLGLDNRFTPEEFELVQLFAAQVSIALQNAEVFQAVEIRARTDNLTGLFNHGTFEEWLDRSVRDGAPFSLIMLDLDDFRDINNDLGHQAGDATLRRIADALVGAGRDTDLVFRYGGDEFTFILPNTDEAGALRVADRVRLAVPAADAAVTASVGTATFPQHGATAHDILLAADRACFVAKSRGRDRVATAAEGLELASELSLQAPTPVDSVGLLGA